MFTVLCYSVQGTVWSHLVHCCATDFSGLTWRCICGTTKNSQTFFLNSSRSVQGKKHRSWWKISPNLPITALPLQARRMWALDPVHRYLWKPCKTFHRDHPQMLRFDMWFKWKQYLDQWSATFPELRAKNTLHGMVGRTNFPPTIPFLLLLLNLGNLWNFNQINYWFSQFITKPKNVTYSTFIVPCRLS